MGHCFSDSATFPKPIPLTQAGIETPFQQNIREPRSPGFGHRGASLNIQEFTEHRDRSAMQLLALGEPSATRLNPTTKLRGKDAKENKRRLGFFSRRRNQEGSASLPKNLSPRKTKEGQNYFHIAIDRPGMQMFGCENSSTYWVNQRRESKSAKRVKKKSSADYYSNERKVTQPRSSPVGSEKTRNADAPQEIAVQHPHIMIKDERDGSQPPLQQQQQGPDPKTLIKSDPRPKAKSGYSSPEANACRLIPRPDMGPNIRDFALGNDLAAVARLAVSSHERHDTGTSSRRTDSPGLIEKFSLSSSPTHLKSRVANNKNKSPIFNSQTSLPVSAAGPQPWPQASFGPSTSPPPLTLLSRTKATQWAAEPQTPQHSAQNSIETKISPLSSISKRSHAPSTNDSTAEDGHSDAESGVIMNAQSAEFVRAHDAAAGYYSQGSRKLPKPGPAPSRALPSLPESHDTATAATAGRIDCRQDQIGVEQPVSLERSPVKAIPHSPNGRYRYSPVKTPAPKSPSPVVVDTKPIAQPERTLSDSPTITHEPQSNIPVLRSELSKRDRSSTALERKQAQRVRSTKALKERDIARLEARQKSLDANRSEEAEREDEDRTETLVLLPRSIYEANTPTKPATVIGTGSEPTYPIPAPTHHRTTSRLSPIILIAEQEPAPAPPPPKPTPPLPQKTPLESPTYHDTLTNLTSRLQSLERKNLLLQRAFLAILNEPAPTPPSISSSPSGARNSTSEEASGCCWTAAAGGAGGAGGAGAGDGGGGGGTRPHSELTEGSESVSTAEARLEAKFETVLEFLRGRGGVGGGGI